MFEFVWYGLLFLLPLPWLVRRYLSSAEQVQQSGLYIPFAHEYRELGLELENTKSNPKWVYLLWLLWVLLLLAVARPQWVGAPVDVQRSGRDLMLAIDLSGSMQTRDFQLQGEVVDRLTATKTIASDFITRRVGDRLGLVLFGSQAYLQTPLTFDRKTVNTFLSEAVIGLAGKDTAIGDAIGLAVKRLKGVNDKSDLVMILLTDGVNTAGALQPEEGLKLAKNIGLRIHTIGIGASQMEVGSFFGSRTVNPSADLDEAMLQHIADETGGKYFRAHDTEELKQIYALIDEIEPVKHDAQNYRPIQSLMKYPLLAAVLVFFVLLLMRVRG